MWSRGTRRDKRPGGRQGPVPEKREALLFLLPLLFLLLVFILVPVGGTFVTSFYRDVPFLEREPVGIENYSFLLSDPDFLRSLRFTLLFVAVSVPLELILGLGAALLLDQKMPLRGLVRAGVLIPWCIPTAVSARVWELVYDFHHGPLNALLAAAGLAGGPVNWLGSETGAFLAIVAADAWKTTPFVAIILLAGLQAIPGELHAQARIDRAGLLARFRRVTLPLLAPVIVVALLFRTIDALRIFDLVYVLTGGGPGGATTSLSLYSYRYFLAGDFGYGSAASVVLFLVALGLSLLYIRAGRFGRVVA